MQKKFYGVSENTGRWDTARDVQRRQCGEQLRDEQTGVRVGVVEVRASGQYDEVVVQAIDALERLSREQFARGDEDAERVGGEEELVCDVLCSFVRRLVLT